jgi:type I restriction enzyme S subunit
MIDILGSIDAKIENSNAIIENLLKNLQLQYALRFLNRDDLQRVPLLYFVENTLGGDWGKEQAEKNFLEEVVCIRGADIPDISSGQNGKPPRRFILKKNLEAKQLSDYEIIVEISGGSPTQSTGRSALITQHLINQYNVPLICTNFCRAIRCKNKVFAAYIYKNSPYAYIIPPIL